jgi:hypothetical protein
VIQEALKSRVGRLTRGHKGKGRVTLGDRLVNSKGLRFGRRLAYKRLKRAGKDSGIRQALKGKQGRGGASLPKYHVNKGGKS